MPAPATAASQLIQEIVDRLDDLADPMDASEARAALRRLRHAQRTAHVSELAALFNTIGSVCFRVQDLQSALDAHRNAARYDTRNAAYLSNVAACLIELGQFQQALPVLRDAMARPLKLPGVEPCILGNMAEVEYNLGNHDVARKRFEEATQLADQERPQDLLNLASTAAVLGVDEDAVEFLARAIAVAKGMTLDETPAIEFVLAEPDRLGVADTRHVSLREALARVAARHNAEAPPEHQLGAQITLSPAGLASVEELIEHPPEPTRTLRMVFDGHRA